MNLNCTIPRGCIQIIFFWSLFLRYNQQRLSNMNYMSQRILVRSFANTAAGKHKLYKVTPALAKVIGTQETTYRSAVSSVWKHLRESKDKV